MCGVLAIITNRENSEATRCLVPKMLKPLQSLRGPDAIGSHHESSSTKSIFLAHARLSIIDLNSSANQPMVDPHTGFSLSFNGSIYNYKELRAELSNSHSFKTHSDTEVLMVCLQKWGLKKTLSHLRGMFSFCAFDRKKNVFYAARDLAGEKPLIYAQLNGDWVFSSDINALQAHPSWHKTLDPRSIVDFLKYRFVPQPHSLFEDVHKLPPGHCIQWNVDSKDDPSIESYWSIWNEKKSSSQEDISLDQAIDQLDSKMTSVCQQMLGASDVPMGCFLSGGIDSSLVAYYLSQNLPNELKAFTIKFQENEFDESSQASALTNTLKLNHTVVPYGFKDFESSLSRNLVGLEEPIAVHSFYPLTDLAKVAATDIKVCFSGDGGDELFLGYNRHFFWQKYMRAFLKCPPFILHNSKRLLNKSFVFSTVSRSLKSFGVNQTESKLEKAVKVLGISDGRSFYKTLLENKIPFIQPLLNRTNFLSRQINSVEDLAKTDFDFYLPHDVLNKLDRSTMTFGIEARAPFLHRDIISFSQQLNVNTKIGRDSGKLILRTLLSKKIDPRFLGSSKQGFTVPIKKWSHSLFTKDFKEELSHSFLAKIIDFKNINIMDHDTLFTMKVLLDWINFNNLKVGNFDL